MSEPTENAGLSEAAPLLSATPTGAPPGIAAPARKSLWPYWLAGAFCLLAAGEVYLFCQQQAHQADKTALAVLQVEVSDMRADAQKTSPVAALLTAQAEFAQKQAMLAAQLNALQGQVSDDHGTLAALQVNAQALGQLTARMAQLNSLAAARMALDAGQPLGVIPHAPPALAVFAETPPPTLGQLKAAFPAAARLGEAASLTASAQPRFWDRVKRRLEGLITISDGQQVIFGPPAAAALSQMQNALANDDLAGMVNAAQNLPASAQTAMADFLTSARQLLAAEQALASMARQGT